MNTSIYGGPALGAKALSKVLSDKNALILDCAAGTGRVGQEVCAHIQSELKNIPLVYLFFKIEKMTFDLMTLQPPPT